MNGLKKAMIFPVSLCLLVALCVPLAAQQSGIYRNEPWNGMQIKYSIGGATITGSSEGGPFCCWINTLKGTLAASGNLSVSGSVGMGAGYEAKAVVTVSVGGQSKSWTGTVKTGSPRMNWATFNVSVPIPSGAASGSILVDMTGSYNAGTRGLSVSGTFTLGGGEAPVPAPPPPPPTPLPPPPPKTIKDAAASAVDDVIHSFDGTCFGNVVRLGNSSKYRTAIISPELKIEDGTPLAISKLSKRGASGALADQTDGWGAPMPNLMFLPFKIPTTAGAPALSPTRKSTIWHESTHHIEEQHGDRETPDFQKHIAYRERNCAYLDAALKELQDLELIERRMRAKNEGESDEDWQDWKLLNGLPGLATIAARFPAIESGVATQEALKGLFKPGDKEVWPPDLRELQGWTGIKISWSDILNRYASGACGKELQKWALTQIHPLPLRL